MKEVLIFSGVVICCGLICCILLYSCQFILINTLYTDLGNRDWQVDVYDGYIIQKLNGSEIILMKEGWSNTSSIVISNHIEAYCFNGYYIGVICAENTKTIPHMETLAQYYIIDTQSKSLLGPYNASEYDIYCSNNQIQNLNQWIYTNSRPQNAT